MQNYQSNKKKDLKQQRLLNSPFYPFHINTFPSLSWINLTLKSQAAEHFHWKGIFGGGPRHKNTLHIKVDTHLFRCKTTSYLYHK